MKLETKNMTIGILYLSLVLFGPFTLLIMPGMFTGVSNLPVFISDNIIYVILWIIGDVIIIGIEVFLTTMLYQVTKRNDQKSALYAFIARMGMIVIMVLNVVVLFRLFSSGLNSEELTNILELHQSGLYLWQIFFFVHLLFLGIILRKESSIPVFIGYGILLGSFAYLLDSIIYFTRLDNAFISVIAGALLGVIALSEIIFGILLIIRRKELFNE